MFFSPTKTNKINSKLTKICSNLQFNPFHTKLKTQKTIQTTLQLCVLRLEVNLKNIINRSKVNIYFILFSS